MASLFRELILKWIGRVPDCFILHFCGFRKAVSGFRCSDLLDLANDSDEEDGPLLSPEGANVFSSLVSHGLDINAEEDDVDDSIGS